MSYCTTTDLVNLTGSTRTTIQLQAIIDQADREINTLLKARGQTGMACEDLKMISLNLSKAGLLDMGLQDGTFQSSSGDFSSSVDVTRAVESLRNAAFALLNEYIEGNTIAAGAKTRVSRVRTYTPRSR